MLETRQDADSISDELIIKKGKQNINMKTDNKHMKTYAEIRLGQERVSLHGTHLISGLRNIVKIF